MDEYKEIWVDRLARALSDKWFEEEYKGWKNKDVYDTEFVDFEGGNARIELIVKPYIASRYLLKLEEYTEFILTFEKK